MNRAGQPTAAPAERSAPADPISLQLVPKRLHWGWWASTALVVLAAVWLVRLMVTNPNFDWPTVAKYFTAEEILAGLGRTLLLTVVAMVAGIAIGIILAVMRLSPVPVVSVVSSAYIWFFRGTPLLVQIIFWYNLAALLPTVSFGIPFGGPQFWSSPTNIVITPFVAAMLGLGLNEGAYMAEIVRGGIQSIDPGQGEAARALGMTSGRLMRRIVLPQAMRVIIPPTGNQVISMLKSSSLVSVTSLPELLYASQLIYQRTFQTIPLLIVASIWYLIATTVLSIGQYYLERRFAKGSRSGLPRTPVQRCRDFLMSVELRLRRSRAIS